jgi:hypothetical protein
MTAIDPAAEAAFRAALGLAAGDPGPPDLAAAAQAVNDAVAATRLDGGSVILLAVWLVWQVRAEAGPPTAQAARRALASAWPLRTSADLTDLAAALLVLCAAFADDEQLAHAAQVGASQP